MQNRPSYLFAGPSLTAESRAAADTCGITILPPAVRGDVADLVKRFAPSMLALADGRFDQTMSVGHAELRTAIERGWQVWGLSSMGAIRAYELRLLGMRGYGRVYHMFLGRHDFQDDEVALLHTTAPPYLAGSEPLVHIRMALRALVREGTLRGAAAQRVLRSMKKLWFGDRTLALFEDLTLQGAIAPSRVRIRQLISDFDRFRIKQKDLTTFLASRPWRTLAATDL